MNVLEVTDPAVLERMGTRSPAFMVEDPTNTRTIKVRLRRVLISFMRSSVNAHRRKRCACQLVREQVNRTRFQGAKQPNSSRFHVGERIATFALTSACS